MKKLLLLLFIAPVLVIAQGEQRYADGTATDQDGNTFEWINYGTQDWAIENAEAVTYRDGTVIPYFHDVYLDEDRLFLNAWTYIDDDPTKGKLYNWYAIMGIHDDASKSDPTLRKEFSPEGWHVPSHTEWTTLEEYLIANGYNYDGTTTGNKIAKALASTTGWDNHGFVYNEAHVNFDQHLNNKSGFNAKPLGYHDPKYNGGVGRYHGETLTAIFWSTTEGDSPNGTYPRNVTVWSRIVNASNSNFGGNDQDGNKSKLYSVRFVRDASTASTNDYSNSITIYPNPTTSIVTLQGGKQYDIEVYTLKGKKVMALTGNTIDMSHLSSATYIVKALDKVENEEVSYKVVKN